MGMKAIDLATPTDPTMGSMTYVAHRDRPDVRGLVVGYPDGEEWALIAWGDASGFTPQFAAGVAVRENTCNLVRWEDRAAATTHVGNVVPEPRAIATVTTLPTNGSTVIHVTPPRPCALECVAELHISMGHGSQMRVHLAEAQRRGIVEALGGTWPA
jgi:hypothetical protein